MKTLYCLFFFFVALPSFSQSNLYHWYPVGDTNDTDGAIYALYNDGIGNLYFGGDFHEIAGEDIDLIAMWDGSQWHDLQFPTSGEINAIEKIGDTLYVAGDFYSSTNQMEDVAMYADGQWYAVGEGLRDKGGTNSTVYCMEAVNGELYIGGDFEEAYQANGAEIEAYFIVKWNGTDFIPLSGKGLEDEVVDMQEHNGKLYIAGEFYETYSAQEMNYVTVYDPVTSFWEPLTDNNTGIIGLEDYATSILVNDTAVFVGGWFDEAGGKPAPYFARYANGEWHPQNGWILDDPVDVATFYHDELYIGGSFQFDDPTGEQINDLAVLVDTSWYDLGEGLVYSSGGQVYDLATYDSSLYISGSFDGGGGVMSENIVRVVKRDTSGSTGISVCDCGTGYSLNPNPATRFVHLSIKAVRPGTAEISIFNGLGQQIMVYPTQHVQEGKQEIRLDLPNLSTGTYFLKISRANNLHVMPMVISQP